jgi:predicted ATPase
MLVTSRERLHIRGEREVAIPPLPVPRPARDTSSEEVAMSPAAQLFVDRAQSYRRDFALTDDVAPVVAEICRRLDGLPLAIELAAARTKVLTAPALLRRLEQSLSILTGGARDLPARQQTMRDTIAWSYDLLAPAEQVLLRRLAVFAGGFTLPAAEAVCDPGKDLGLAVLDGVASLVDKSLLTQDDRDDGEPRFSMFETIREYLLERLTESGEAPAIRTAHLRLYRRMAQEAYANLVGQQQLVWMARLDPEIDNVRSALTWALSEARTVPNGLTLAALLTWFWLQSGRLREGREWLARLLTTDSRAVAEARAAALFAAAQLAVYGSGFRDAYAPLDECVAVCRGLPSPIPIYPMALAMLGPMLHLRGDLDAARRSTDEAMDVARQAGDQTLLAHVLFWRGRTAYLLADLDAAEQAWQEGLDTLRDRRDRLMIAGFLGRLGDLAYRQGDMYTARRRCEQSIAIWRSMGDIQGVAQDLATLGRVALMEGDERQAAQLFRASLAYAKEAGSTVEIPLALSGLAMVSAVRGELRPAAVWYGAAAALGDVVGLPLGEVFPGELDDRVADVRSALGTSEFESAWQVGRALSFDEALAGVLDSVEDSTTLDRLGRTLTAGA